MLLAGSSFNSPNVKWMTFLKWFGRNSFSAMVIHNPIKGFMAVIMGAAFACGTSAVSQNVLYSILNFIITLIITILGIHIINWIKGKYINR